jgi:WD40 repeat protein
MGNGDVGLLSARDGTVRGTTRGKGTDLSTAIASSADGVWVAVGRESTLRVQAPPLAPRAGRGLVEFHNVDEPSALVFVPGSDTLLSAPFGEGFAAFDLGGAGKPTVIDAHGSSADALALAPSGKLLASGGGDGEVQLWRLPELVRVGRPFKGHLGSVSDVAFSADGRTVASASTDKTVLLSDTATNELLATMFVDGDRWLVMAEDGRVDGNDVNNADDSMYWQVGDIRLPSFVGWDRSRTPNLVRAILNRR